MIILYNKKIDDNIQLDLNAHIITHVITNYYKKINPFVPK